MNDHRIERRDEEDAEMPKRITIAPHLTEEELCQRYRQSKEVTERTHYQIIWLLTQGKKTKEVAEITGYSLNWL